MPRLPRTSVAQQTPAADDLRPPNAFLLMLEIRASWEFGAMLAATPWLRRLPRGDGHAGFVCPGMGANDFTTVPLRNFLGGLGYVAQAWGQAFNVGPRDGVLKKCAADVRIFEMLCGQKAHDPAMIARLRTPPALPTTSIHSRTDGIVAWQCSLNDPGPQVENIEVQASHTGLGMNPLALYAVADRLAQAPGERAPFDARCARRWFFRTGVNPNSAASA